MESVGGASHAHTRSGVEKTIRVALAAMLRELPATQLDAAVALAVEGYVTEHLARRGTVHEG